MSLKEGVVEEINRGNELEMGWGSIGEDFIFTKHRTLNCCLFSILSLLSLLGQPKIHMT